MVIPISTRTGVPGGASKVFLTEIETVAKGVISTRLIALFKGLMDYENAARTAMKQRANALQPPAATNPGTLSFNVPMTAFSAPQA